MTSSSRARSSYCKLALIAAFSLPCLSAFAQQPSSSNAPADQQIAPGVAVDSARKSTDLPGYVTTSENEGAKAGVYEVRQSVEFGGRVTSFSGNPGMWDTYVDLGSGPRLLEQTLDLHAPAHNGLLFDDLTFSNFGYGGDPNDLTRLMVQKGTIYRLQANFKRDKYFFDYDLLANPLNPPPNTPIADSPHLMNQTRHMGDVNLTFFEQAPVRLRLGYSHFSNTGTDFSTIHEGTETMLRQPTSDRTENYQAGVSLRFIPRTSINYDQFYTHYKNDTSWQLAALPFTLANGTAADVGIALNLGAGQPCAAPFTGAFVTPTCNLYTGYTRFSPTRNGYPTEQLSFQTAYWKNVDMSGRISYNSASSDRPDFSEIFQGLSTRTRQVFQQQTGPAHTHRVGANADYGVTFHVTERFRIVDNFRWTDFRIPGTWAEQQTSQFSASAAVAPIIFNPANPNGCPATPAKCPQHSSSSGADVSTDLYSNYLAQNMKVNTFELEYDFTPRLTGRIGYRFERRDIVRDFSYVNQSTFYPLLPTRGGCTNVVNNICTSTSTTSDSGTTEINANSGIFGISWRPVDTFRFAFDTEFFSADNTFTRITPRQLQIYKIRAGYKPRTWASFNSSIVIRENRNNVPDVGNLQHNRSYAFGVDLSPNEKWSFDFSYDYNDIFSQTNICYVATPNAFAAPVGCGAAPYLAGLSVYTETAHSISTGLLAHPIPRVTAGIGYTVTDSSGSALILNPNAPTGPLTYLYHLPSATLAIDLAKHLQYKTGWNYYGYGESSAVGPTAPRNFHGNVFTLSMRYSM
jgi:hypothetical protein